MSWNLTTVNDTHLQCQPDTSLETDLYVSDFNTAALDRRLLAPPPDLTLQAECCEDLRKMPVRRVKAKVLADRESKPSSSASSEELFRKTLPGAADLDGLTNGTSLDFLVTTRYRNDSEFFLSCSNAVLRAAIRGNAVTFPSQVMWLGRREESDIGRRIIQLYFVGGWPVHRISDRYLLSKTGVHRILREWRRRAIALGFLQEIQSDREGSVPCTSGTPIGDRSTVTCGLRKSSSETGKNRVLGALISALEDQCEELGLHISTFRFSRIEEALRLILGPALSSGVAVDVAKPAVKGADLYREG